jgi:squalene-hopene/tetraprenyl-beta-curcumene cyclase
MTYTGFKSMLYANVARTDPRVKAAMEWIARYWRLDSNPNMPQKQSEQGLYYYYQVFGKALRAWGEDTVTDAKGDKHNWRQELIEALKQRQSAEGSWSNEADRWMEGSPILVTVYCLTALQDATAP